MTPIGLTRPTLAGERYEPPLSITIEPQLPPKRIVKPHKPTRADLDIQDQRFGRLVAVRPFINNGHGTEWLCICDCGKEIVTQRSNLRYGRTKSCGCLRREVTSERMKKKP